MANPLYANYSLNDFDRFDCLKLSKVIYFMLALVLRGYIVWIVSVTNMKDRVTIIQFVYPQTSLFYLSLVSGAIGLLVVLLICLRRPQAGAWSKALWPYTRLLLVLALSFDMVVNLIAYGYWQLLSVEWLMAQMVISVLLIIAGYRSQRFNLNLQEFPQPISDN